MKEIGSEFWDVPVKGSESFFFPESTQWYLSGRNALQAVIKELRNIKSINMPSWCCDSMIKPFVEAGIDVNFYSVFFNGSLVQEIEMSGEALFLMDYFGYTMSAPNLNGYQGTIIRDLTHSIFSTIHDDADYFFGSLRKWCGFWTGGYAWAKNSRLEPSQKDNKSYITLRQDAMKEKENYIHSHSSQKRYLEKFREAEEMLESTDIANAADRDVCLVKRLDIEFIRNQRRTNAEVLRNSLPEWLMFPKIGRNDCPMFVPILVPDGKRDELRRFLINKDIFCPIHWPVSRYHRLNKWTSQIYENEISLICDQRYTEKDMYRIVDAIDEFWKKV